VAITTTTPKAQFVCVSGFADIATNPQSVQFLFSNPPDVSQSAPQPAIERYLRDLIVTWPANGTRLMQTISLRNSANIIWSATSPSSPLSLGLADWTGTYRNIAPGTIQPMQLRFNFNVAGTGTYTVQTVWDNGAGGGACTAASVSVTP
ncbi:MAG TPA: hypothetical protein PK954_16230, partial [Anaerolineales bacterium]|nr:hypothetical protein [Anaerolineales bacterium]